MGSGGKISIVGGTVYAQKNGDFAPYDVGNGQGGMDVTLSISGDSAVLLKNNLCVTPTTTTHAQYSTNIQTNGIVFGKLDVPTGWEGNTIYAYLNTSEVGMLTFDANGGTGNVPEQRIQYNGTTTVLPDGNGLIKNRLHLLNWDTQTDGLGTEYTVGDTYTFISNTLLYAQYEDPVHVGGINLSSHEETIGLGETLALTANVLPEDATYPEVTWSSDNETVATVSQGGMITGKSKGDVTITVTTEDGGYTDTCKVTVNQPVTGVTLNKSSVELLVGDTESLTATVSPSNATDKSVTWSSSNTSVATVVNGIISAKGTGTAVITVKTGGGEYTKTCTVRVNTPSVSYQTHVQNVGWQGWKSNGEVAGTSGQSLRLEGMNIEIDGMPDAIEYRTHVQDIGWQGWIRDGEMTGTSGRSLRLEAIEIRLKGDMAANYDIYYRVHAQNIGWMDWAKNGQSAGTAGLSYRLEAIQIQLVPKGGAAPGSTAVPFRDANGPVPTNPNPIGPEPTKPTSDVPVKYQTHVQDIGWQGWKRSGEVAGTSGQSLRLEGMYIDVEGADNAVEYRTHVQDIGWQGWVNEGEMTGTSGRSLRLEAIEIRLKGDMAAKYDIYYRVHAQNVGWMDWAKNGQSAGTAGLSYRLEAIQIIIVQKDGAAPGATARPFVSA